MLPHKERLGKGGSLDPCPKPSTGQLDSYEQFARVAPEYGRWTTGDHQRRRQISTHTCHLVDMVGKKQ